ncbi:hypothetical protein BGZ58_001664, partial [Dissophora ornata]
MSDKESRKTITVDLAKELNGLRGFADNENGVKYLIDPKTIDIDDLRQAAENGQAKEFFMQNYAFKIPT